MITSRDGVAQALDLALIGHLTSVSPSGQPQTSPVWFLRDGEDLIVYNRPESPRLANIAANPRVALALRADRRGSGLVSLEGRTTVDPTLPKPDTDPAYLEKYRDEIAGLGWTPAQFASLYSVGLRVEVTRVRVSSVSDVIGAEID